jgi:protein O-GlcNAc transferase
MTVRPDPDEAAAKFREGVAYHQKGQLGPAQEIYRQVLQAYPQHFDALNLSGVIAAQMANFAEAVKLIGQAVDLNPNNAGAHYNHGMALEGAMNFAAAADSYSRAIHLNPSYAEAYNNRGNALRSLKQYQAAIDSYNHALQIRPDFAEAYANRANAELDIGSPQTALESCDKALQIKPDMVEAHNNRGKALRALNRIDDAIASHRRAIALRPNYAEAYSNLGNTLRVGGQHQAALENYEKAIALKPGDADIYFNRGNTQRAMQQREAAAASFERAVALRADFAEAWNERGIVLGEQGQHLEAIISYDNAVRVKPDFAEAYINRGVSLRESKQPEEAVKSYDKAIALNPNHAGAYNNRGVAFTDLRQHQAALESYTKAISLQPDYAEAHNNRGVALKSLDQKEAALSAFSRAIELKPDIASAYQNRGIVLSDLKRYEEALASYGKALELQPDYPLLYTTWLYVKMQICDWRGLDGQIAELKRRIENSEKSGPSFPVLAFTSSLPLQQKAAEIWTQEMYPANGYLGPLAKYPRHKKIRIGCFSTDFCLHALALLVSGLFEEHDRKDFEFHAFSYGPNTGDDVRERLKKSFDTFTDVRAESPAKIAQMSRDMEIDIAVDFTGHTANAPTGIFALRAAPIQVNYLGYPGTMGAAYMDYIIADQTVIPEGHRPFYNEKVAYLPNCYQSNDSTRKISDKVFTRAELGLPEKGFVFCCFNNSYKLMPDSFGAWMRILNSVDGSVLWLLEDNAVAVRNLRREAQERGVSPERLIFAARTPLAEHLARHRAADLFLDTLPYNAHTTASDALWAGLPLLTRIGDAFAGRVAASLLNAIDMSDLITTTDDDFERTAIALATDPDRLAKIKQRLSRRRLTTPLFNTKLFARQLEDLYRQMFERHHAGLQPDHIFAARNASSRKK